MRKITVKFDKLKDIQNLRKIMHNVYASNSDHLPDIAKFNLGKSFAPHQVDRAELHIETLSGTDIITVSKGSLSFFVGNQHPFSKVAITSEDEAKYIVLPWSLTSRIGRDNLKNLINRIPSNTKTLKYIIYINSQNTNSLNNLHSLDSNSDLSASLTSLASLHLSDIMAEDETEGLLSKIDDLEQRLKETQELQTVLTKSKGEIVARDNLVSQKQNENANLLRQVEQKQAQINSLTTQLANLQTQMRTQTQTITAQPWTLAIPNNIRGDLNGAAHWNLGGAITTATGWKSYASINDVTGNVTIDVANRILTIGGSSCGSVNAY
jgi:hypothetical protein